jgi:transketolase
MHRTDGPSALFLTRQTVPTYDGVPVSVRREGVYDGGYILKKETGELDAILIASGSEVEHCMRAAEELGDGIRVVSMPCMERFERQSEDYRQSVLPASCTRRVVIEAGVSSLWSKYAGPAGKVLGIDRFGISAPGGVVMEQLGMTARHVIEAVKALD